MGATGGEPVGEDGAATPAGGRVRPHGRSALDAEVGFVPVGLWLRAVALGHQVVVSPKH